jgi:thioredoxin reductase (NADPH)
MHFFSTAERLEIGGVPFMSLNNKPNRAEAVEYYRRVAIMYNLNIQLFEEVKQVSKSLNNPDVEEFKFEVTTPKNTYHSNNIIVSTGFYDIPVLLNVPGENLLKVRHYYNDPHYYCLQKVIVVGASNSAVDAALEVFRKGAEVTMVVRESNISERVKYWVRPDIINRIEEGSIKVFFNSHVAAIRENEVDIQTPNEQVTIENNFVLAMTGYRPDFKLLHKCGVELSDDDIKFPYYNSETMETNVPGIYLAGVVCGGMNTHKWFIENSRIHADLIVKHVLTTLI